MAACKVALETNVVGRLLPFHWTVEDVTKFAPVTDSINPASPAKAEEGLTEVIVGFGFCIAVLPPPPHPVGNSAVNTHSSKATARYIRKAHSKELRTRVPVDIRWPVSIGDLVRTPVTPPQPSWQPAVVRYIHQPPSCCKRQSATQRQCRTLSSTLYLRSLGLGLIGWPGHALSSAPTRMRSGDVSSDQVWKAANPGDRSLFTT